MSIEGRIAKLEQRTGLGEPAADVVMLVTAGGPVEMTPEEWRRYEAEHPGERITIRERSE